MTTYADPDARPRRRGADEPPPKPPKPKDPMWAKLCLIIGSIVMVASGAAVVLPKLIANWATDDITQAPLIPQELQGENIDGAVNLLLLGMDERSPTQTDLIRADTIILVHVPASHDKVYMISFPRDTEVDIPDFPETNFKGFKTKINAAFAFGARKDGNKPDNSTEGRTRGANLTMQTISNLVPDGLKFNGAAIINFSGFRNVLKAIGGVDMCVDKETRSIHYDNKNKYHTAEVPYNNRKIYKKGCYHFVYWEALDFARQRHFDQGDDYDRQRHQQQLLMAIFKKLTSKGVLTSPSMLSNLQKSAGELLTLDLGKTEILDWAFTFKRLGSDKIVMIKTNGGKSTPGTIKGNEMLNAESMKLLQAVHDDTVGDFHSSHPSWVATEKG